MSKTENALATTENKQTLTTTNANYDTALAMMSPEDKDKCRAMTANISESDSGSLRVFGAEISDIYTRGSEDILQRTHSNAIGEGNAQSIIDLNTELAKQMTAINIKELSGELPFVKRMLCKIPIIGEKMVISAETLKMKYNPVAENIKEITTALDNYALKGLESNKRLEVNRIQVMDAIKHSHESILALMVKIEDEQALLDEMNAHPENYEMADIKRKSDFVERMNRKVNSMQKVEYGLSLNLLEIQATYNKNEQLADRNDDIVTNVIPQFKLQLALAIEQAEQAKFANAQNKVIDGGNQLLIENAKTFHDNQVAVAKSINRDVFDIDTLKKATSEIVAAANDVKKIQQKYTDEAKHTRDEIRKLYLEMENALSVE